MILHEPPEIGDGSDRANAAILDLLFNGLAV